MSKPKPFTSSFWGIIIVLIIAVVMLGVANYRGYRAGFNLPFTPITTEQAKPSKTEPNTAHLFTSQVELERICDPLDNNPINWDKQVALGYTITNLSSGYQLNLLSVRRQSNTIDIRYHRTTPEDNPDTVYTQVISYPVILAIVDRTKLIASSELVVNFIINDTVIQTLKIPPNKI